MMDRKEMIAKAKEMGLEFKGNISNADLQELIEYSVDDTAVEALAEAIEKQAEEVKVEEKKPEVEQMTEGQIKAKARKDAHKLVRCIVTTMDKDKSELHGEIFSASNSFTGFVKKYIPFNAEYHIPQILLDTIQEKKMLATRTRKTPKGDVKENIEVPAYSINILPDLTQEELDRLKAEAK